jgi:drug/metabolite transporter (DMT)-like permease
LIASRQYWIGIALTALGAVILSPDAMLFKLVGADLWTASFWRLVFMGSAVSAWLLLTRGRRLIADVRAIGWLLLPASLCMCFSNIGFLYSLGHSSVAETLTVIATAPIFAALFAMILGEKPPLQTWLAAVIVAVGIGIIVDASFPLGSWHGILGAMASAISIAAFFTLCRARKSVEMTPALAFSAFLSAGIAASLALSLALPPNDLPYLALSGLVVLPISFILITLGPKRLPAAEVGLLMLLETALGPIWAWAILEEIPAQTTLLGGGLIVSALIAHSVAALWHRKPSMP